MTLATRCRSMGDPKPHTQVFHSRTPIQTLQPRSHPPHDPAVQQFNGSGTRAFKQPNESNVTAFPGELNPNSIQQREIRRRPSSSHYSSFAPQPRQRLIACANPKLCGHMFHPFSRQVKRRTEPRTTPVFFSLFFSPVMYARDSRAVRDPVRVRRVANGGCITISKRS